MRSLIIALNDHVLKVFKGTTGVGSKSLDEYFTKTPNPSDAIDVIRDLMDSEKKFHCFHCYGSIAHSSGIAPTIVIATQNAFVLPLNAFITFDEIIIVGSTNPVHWRVIKKLKNFPIYDGMNDGADEKDGVITKEQYIADLHKRYGSEEDLKEENNTREAPDVKLSKYHNAIKYNSDSNGSNSSMHADTPSGLNELMGKFIRDALTTEIVPGRYFRHRKFTGNIINCHIRIFDYPIKGEHKCLVAGDHIRTLSGILSRLGDALGYDEMRSFLEGTLPIGTDNTPSLTMSYYGDFVHIYFVYDNITFMITK